MKVIQPPEFRLTPEFIAPIMKRTLEYSKGQPSPVTNKGLYAHWEKVRHLTPPEGMTAEEYWQTLKMTRLSRARLLPFTDVRGTQFWFCQTEQLFEFQHWLDKQAGGTISVVSSDALSQKPNKRFLMDGQADEAIYSSMLEGAVTTRQDARKILMRKNPRPANHSERMVINNYRAMEFIEQNRQEALSVQMILALHKIITENTLDNSSDEGNLRRSNDVLVRDNMDDSVVHTPPPFDGLLNQLQQLCDFANDEKEFIHPALRAITLHFMLAYIHPFVDGNGRTARALFYREMMRHDYWLIAYISISESIRKASGQYARAFLHSETDGGDLTYFFLHQAKVIRDSFARFNQHLQKQKRNMQKVARWEKYMQSESDLNPRQIALLSHAAKKPNCIFTAGGHQVYHHVTHATAQADLRKLEAKGWLTSNKVGREYMYIPSNDFAQRIQESGMA